MATQNDVENVVNRLRTAWNSFKSSGNLQRVEVDVSSAVALAEEMEMELEKASGTSPDATGVGTAGPAVPNATVADSVSAPADTAPAAGSDFSKLS